MNPSDAKRISKFLSLILRHKPEEAGICLDENGWTNVAILLQKLKISKADLDYVVKNNDKKRFAYNADQSEIRASQGHSLDVDLKLVAKIPPKQLFHGSAEKNVDSILKHGLEKRNRQHVHLSFNRETATSVGQRHGTPVIFKIDSLKMQTDGYAFYQSENGVWLTDFVPVEYISLD